MIIVYGFIMVFGVVMLVFIGLVNWLIFMMIGVLDMVLLCMNNWSFWIFSGVFLILLSLLFMEGGGFVFGWMFYVLFFIIYSNDLMGLFVFLVYIMGIFFIMGVINVIVIIFNMCVSGMIWMKMFLFVWIWFIIVFLLIVVMLVLVGVVIMVLMDKFFGISFFDVVGGGDFVMF